MKSNDPPYFLQSLGFLGNNFEELQTVLIGVELIINNAPLTYIYPNTIETCYLLLTCIHSIICYFADDYIFF